MAFWAFQCFLLLALCPNWLQVRASEPEESAESPKHLLQELADCDTDDMGCVARKTACSLATKLAHDWPVSYSAINETLGQLQDVCDGKPLALTSETSGEALEVEVLEEMKVSNVSFLSHGDECSDPGECTTNVEKYEKENPGAKYGMKAGTAAARAAFDTLNLILNSAGMIALKGNIAFAFIGSFIFAFFPSAGGLPANPCTYATEDWGRCVWEQVKPFVQEFVSDQLDEAFEEIWKATIDGYQTRLWALNATACKNSELYPNGTVKEMSNQTRDRMYDSLMEVNHAMLGDINLFMTGRAIKTTAGAYLSQFASLHISVMTNILGSLKYRTTGDRYVFQTASGCYALRVYEFATAALKSRMAALEEHKEKISDVRKCCAVLGRPGDCSECPMVKVSFKDAWKLECDWKDSGYHAACDYLLGLCMTKPSMDSQRFAETCYRNHYNEVQKQTVSFWQNWLAPIPIWLNNVVLMQQIEVHKEGALGDIKFDCSAI